MSLFTGVETGVTLGVLLGALGVLLGTAGEETGSTVGLGTGELGGCEMGGDGVVESLATIWNSGLMLPELPMTR